LILEAVERPRKVIPTFTTILINRYNKNKEIRFWPLIQGKGSKLLAIKKFVLNCRLADFYNSDIEISTTLTSPFLVPAIHSKKELKINPLPGFVFPHAISNFNFD